MTDNDTNPSTCEHCTFSPFCIAEENSLDWINQNNHTVKQHHHLKKNEPLYLPQNMFRNLYAIQRGTLKTYQVDANGNELIQGFYFAGEVLGFEAIYSRHYLFSAVALSDTVVCEIPYDNFLELLQLNPSLQKHILYLMSQQLSVGSYLCYITAEQRLAAFLIDLATRLHPLEMQLQFLLPMSRQDIGNYLRLTAETISRLLAQFKKNKLIAIDQKNIQLLQPEQLKLIADMEHCSVMKNQGIFRKS
ncbi:helix-turn-helix domain-containing protein [Legionella bononiensis]|uniref:Helix-turn-helix domain-containing protein n=1 Tax=Legionella bononiensis TaxID=2793102 RepID=A0ABS1W784_9GAMM|nr:helix-turn-helix domain-containing protein [Legionella bononiensis]MBL7481318.1 helix-turn-helix domain-containing protein [Legionella bononiensis]MBL7525222.1 helix-turn-helix domain-containing protein [Legionella bononiensis]MBL7561405.1 helix-turn-helix domain-containing protein [Legionella bononiensis]